MSKSIEEISKYTANSGGKTDSNLANDALHLGGIPADEYATQKYVQQYHENKENALKEYIDEQDNSKLEEAKSYADQIVAGQDFSGFAKLTDVQAVDTKLSNEIANEIASCKTECANNLARKTNAIVKDVNANFDDVNTSLNNVYNSIRTLNSSQDDLFQSVSNGKAKVAAAITDKGITTASDASYDTMAGNIRQIRTSSEEGEVDENYINTSDATATASDILLGKTAYAQGQKIYGTLIAQAEEGVPTYGTDTSGATATASDIAYGKTAYARGQLIVGTLQNTDVEEIYGVDTSNYTVKDLMTVEKDPTTESTEEEETIITSRKHIAFSKGMGYCVSEVQLNNDTSTSYIESFAINDDGMFIQGSINGSGEITYYKYRYTLDELGITGKILDIAITTGGVDGISTKAYLLILTKDTVTENETTTYELKLHVYIYYTNGDGAIGILSNNSTDVVKSSTNDYFASGYICTSNLTHNRFAILGDNPNGVGHERLHCYMYKILESDTNIGFVKSEYSGGNEGYFGWFQPVFTSDDRYIQSRGNNSELLLKIDIENNYKPIFAKAYSDYKNVEGTDYAIYFNSLKMYTIHLSGDDSLSWTEISSITLDTSNTSLDGGSIEDFIILPGNEHIIAILIDGNKRYMVDIEIGNIFDSENVYAKVIKSEYIITSSSAYFWMKASARSTLIYLLAYDSSLSLTNLYKISLMTDSSNIFGLKYKGQYFYNQKVHQLSAGQPDVREGKTFIGWMGYPEIGTMEVSE